MYGIIPTHIRRSSTVSDKAKLIYAEITASLDENMSCRLTNQEIADIFDISVTTARRHLYELRDLGQILVSEDEDGRCISLPEGIVKIEEVVKKKPSVKSVEEAKEFTSEMVSLWNQSLGTKIKVTPSLISCMASRLRSFGKEDVDRAIRNRISFVIASKWHNEEENLHHRNDIYLVVRNDKSLQKSLISVKGKSESFSRMKFS